MKLQEIIRLSKTNEDSYSQVMESLRPPIFWKDKPVISQQLKKWSHQTLRIMAQKINETEILMKKNSYIRNDIVIKDLIIKLTNKAALSTS